METFFISEGNRKYFIKGIREISPQIQKEITEYPTTEGTPLSDHAYLRPTTLNIGLMVDGMNSHTQSYVVDESGQHDLDYTELKNLIYRWERTNVRLDIQTNHRLFRNMMLQNVSWSESSQGWTKFTPQLGFKEVRIAGFVRDRVQGIEPLDQTLRNRPVEGGQNNGGVTSASVLGSMAAGAAFGAILGPKGAAVGAIVGGAIGFFRR